MISLYWRAAVAIKLGYCHARTEFRVRAPGGNRSLPDGGDGVIKWVLERDHFRLSDLTGVRPNADDKRLLEITQPLAAVGALEAL